MASEDSYTVRFFVFSPRTVDYEALACRSFLLIARTGEIVTIHYGE
jgi:hypothetical protein